MGSARLAVTSVTAAAAGAWVSSSARSVSEVSSGHVAVGHQDRAVEVVRQPVEGTLDGPAGARDLVLVGDEDVRGRGS